jgi:hypothetical protein
VEPHVAPGDRSLEDLERAECEQDAHGRDALPPGGFIAKESQVCRVRKGRPGAACGTTIDLDFERDGIVVLPGAFDATGMEDEVWGVLGRRYRIHRDAPSTWAPGIFGKLTKWATGRFARVETAPVRDAITDVLGGPWHTLEPWGKPLITFPTPGPWDVPAGWHLDVPPSTPLTVLRMFAFVSAVRPGGGGTVLVAGAHRLMAGLDGARSSDVRRALADRSPWFADLWRGDGSDRVERFMGAGEDIDGVRLRVVELTGEPGDVVLWHSTLPHAIAPNCSDRVRMMLTNTAHRRQGVGVGR